MNLIVLSLDYNDFQIAYNAIKSWYLPWIFVGENSRIVYLIIFRPD